MFGEDFFVCVWPHAVFLFFGGGLFRAVVEKYLLEKSRLVSHEKGER